MEGIQKVALRSRPKLEPSQGQAHGDGTDDDEAMGPPPPCYRLTTFFFSDELDERNEPLGERIERIEACSAMCYTQCPYRMRCLIFALRNPQEYGIWGGWNKTEMKKFKHWLKLCIDRQPVQISDAELEWEIQFYEGATAWPDYPRDRPIHLKHRGRVLEWLTGDGELPDSRTVEFA